MAGPFLITDQTLDRLAERRSEFDHLERSGSRQVLHRREGIAGSEAMPSFGSEATIPPATSGKCVVRHSTARERSGARAVR